MAKMIEDRWLQEERLGAPWDLKGGARIADSVFEADEDEALWTELPSARFVTSEPVQMTREELEEATRFGHAMLKAAAQEMPATGTLKQGLQALCDGFFAEDIADRVADVLNTTEDQAEE